MSYAPPVWLSNVTMDIGPMSSGPSAMSNMTVVSNSGWGLWKLMSASSAVVSQNFLIGCRCCSFNFLLWMPPLRQYLERKIEDVKKRLGFLVKSQWIEQKDCRVSWLFQESQIVSVCLQCPSLLFFILVY